MDVNTGFPGEADELFQNTMNFIQSLPVSYLHVFTYSERANTTALRIQDVVPIEKRQLRTNQLRLLSEKKKRAFYHGFIQQERTVLWEGVDEEGRMMGYTDNYIRLSKPFDTAQVNTLESVVIENNGVKFEF